MRRGSGEVSRHVNEDLAGLGYAPQGYDWYEDQIVPDRKLEIIHKLAHDQPVGTDVPYGDLKTVAAEFSPLRYELTEPEIKKYRWVGQQATEAVNCIPDSVRSKSNLWRRTNSCVADSVRLSC